MIAFSCWYFERKLTIEEVKDKIEKDRVKMSTNYSNITMDPIMSTNFEIEELNYLDKQYKYLILNLKLDEVQETQLIIFSVNEQVFMNVLRGKNSVPKITKEYFDDTNWGSIKERIFNIDEDFLYWIFKSYIDTREIPIVEDKEIYVTGLKSYKGVVRDLGTSLKGHGERICEILSTLAFLLNDDELKMVAPKLTYVTYTADEKNSIHFSIYLTGTIRFDICNYDGDLMNHEKYGIETEKMPYILSILISDYLMPQIIKGYRMAKKDNYWNSSIKRDFLRRVGIEIRIRVDNEIARLEEESMSDKQTVIDNSTKESLKNDDIEAVEELIAEGALEN